MGLDWRADQQLNGPTGMKMTFFLIPTVLVAFFLALPPALIRKSWTQFWIGFVLSPFAVVLPLAFFFLSMFLTPDSKEVCHNGALDCFHLGKLALSPFVLWATAALYAVEIAEVRNPGRPWIVNGLVLGAIISSVCTVFGVLTNRQDNVMLFCLAVPLYTSIWYIARAVHTIRTQPIDSTKLTIALGSSLPFWALSVWWSYKTYLSLPDHVESCFVVTAASRGHRGIVGPHFNVVRRRCHRVANYQLATFWTFEALWRKTAPRSHAAFRRIYNIIGPIIARRITSPWIADVVYVLLKPAEFFARFVVNTNLLLGTQKRDSSPRLLHTQGAPILNLQS